MIKFLKSLNVLNFIEDHVGLIIILGALAGFFIPGFNKIPSWVVLVNVASVVFFSCFGLTAMDLGSFSIKHLAIYYLLRFIALPLFVFYSLIFVLPGLAPSLALLYSLPAGVSTPSFAGIFGGNVTVALIICLLTHLLCPLTIPLISQYTVGKVVEIDTISLFTSLCMTVLLPVALYFLLRKSQTVISSIKQYSKVTSIVLIATLGTFAIGLQRQEVINNLESLPYLTLVACIAFLFQFTLPWFLSKGTGRRTRLSFTIASGFNNTALGIGISLLYFPAATTLFLVICEVPWCLAPAIFAKTLGRPLPPEEPTS